MSSVGLSSISMKALCLGLGLGLGLPRSGVFFSLFYLRTSTSPALCSNSWLLLFSANFEIFLKLEPLV